MHHSTVDKHREGGRRMKGGVFVFLWCSTPECTQAVLMQSYGGGSWKGISWFQSSNLDLVYMTENLLSECTMWSDEGLCRPKRYHQLNILTLGTRSVQLLLFLTFNSWMLPTAALILFVESWIHKRNLLEWGSVFPSVGHQRQQRGQAETLTLPLYWMSHAEKPPPPTASMPG